MSLREEYECMDIVIPQKAVEIIVTNIVNPYFIRICEVPQNYKAKDELSRVLQKVVKSDLTKTLNDDYTPIIGDNVIISNQLDLPSWICRGIITDTATKTTDVFLIDYGIIVNVPTKSVLKYSPTSVKIKALTSVIGINNILPADISKFQISKVWPETTINFIKYLIESSNKIYFEALACEKKTNYKRGELFLVMENKNICLSKVLICSLLAIPLYYEGLLQAMKADDTTNEIVLPYHLKQQKIIEASVVTKENEFSEKRKTIRKKETSDTILIRSNFTCKPLLHLADSGFDLLVQKALHNNGVKAPRHIQSYMWPAINQGLNVVTISTQSSGKTVGYIVPIASNIGNNEEAIIEKQKKCIEIAKPMVLVLCATTSECINVAATYKNILYSHKTIKSYAAFPGLTDSQIFSNIHNKFHILISTPSFLCRLLQKFSKHLNVAELSYLVLDDVDILLNKYLPELKILIDRFKIINKENQNFIQGGSMQIIINGQTWTERVCSFINTYIENPHICISSFVEAAAFNKVQGRMLIRHSDQKKREVLEVLGDYLKIKTMIFCVNSEEAKELSDFLVSNSIETLLIHEEIVITKIHEIRQQWIRYLSGMYPVIICTDEVLSELEISDIEFLIHYSITSTSKTQFNRRFSVLMDNWLSEPKTKCKMLILFDETKENVHFRGVVKILERLQVELPHDWNQIAEGLDLANDLKKKNYPLCDCFKMFGSCEANPCLYRHRVIAEVDVPTTKVSIGDELKMIVTHVHSASHFSARICDSVRKDELTQKEIVTKFENNIVHVNMKMLKYYSRHGNRRAEKEICVGNICAWKQPNDTFERVQILNIVERDIRTEKPLIVRLRVIDDGRILERIYASELYEISKEILQEKTPIVDVFLSNIAPFDELKWTDIATEVVQKWFNDQQSGTSHISIKVGLHLGHSIWTDSVVSKSKLMGYKDLISSSLSDHIKKNGYGTGNRGLLNKLKKLCIYGGLTEINGHSLKVFEEENKKNTPIDECD